MEKRNEIVSYVLLVCDDDTGEKFLVECRSDELGKESFYVTFSNVRIRFRSIDSVLDFLEMNKDFGYVE